MSNKRIPAEPVKILVTVEVTVDAANIVEKYSNFSVNYGVKEGRPTKRALLDFARRSVNKERSMRNFGFNVNVMEAKFIGEDVK